MASFQTMELNSMSSFYISSRHHKNLSSASFLFHSSRQNNVRIRSLIPYFSISIEAQQKEETPFIAQYLISSFGFSEERALKVATQKALARIKTLDRPESVVRFLKGIGLTDIQIKNAIFLAPQVLSQNVSKTLEPCAREVIAAGFTEEILIQLIRFNPWALTYKSLLPRLQFWSNFVGNDEKALLKLLKNRMLLDFDLDKRIIPRINLLREYGLSDQQIAKMIMNMDYLFIRTPDQLKLLFEQIEKLGFSPGSKMFLEGLIVIGSFNKDTLEKKMQFFKETYSWSQEDINLALKKFPRLLNHSEKSLRAKMDFLISKVGLSPKNIALLPTLLSYSVERRLIPRYYVLNVLKLQSKDFKINLAFSTVAIMSEEKFIEKCILPYSKELPNLEEEYAAACAGKLTKANLV